jgi:hypothetical protein
LFSRFLGRPLGLSDFFCPSAQGLRLWLALPSSWAPYPKSAKPRELIIIIAVWTGRRLLGLLADRHLWRTAKHIALHYNYSILFSLTNSISSQEVTAFIMALGRSDPFGQLAFLAPAICDVDI